MIEYNKSYFVLEVDAAVKLYNKLINWLKLAKYV